jgi:hypothetical protein
MRNRYDQPVRVTEKLPEKFAKFCSADAGISLRRIKDRCNSAAASFETRRRVPR